MRLFLHIFLFCCVFPSLTHSFVYRINTVNATTHINLDGSTDVLSIELIENPSTGYGWSVQYDVGLLNVLFDTISMPNSAQHRYRVGAARKRVVNLVGYTSVSLTHVALQLNRPWATAPKSTQPLIISVTILSSSSSSDPALYNNCQPNKTSLGATHRAIMKPRRSTDSGARIRAYDVITNAIPDVYDPRSTTGYPAIRDQGQCGSCWAFATVGMLEVMTGLRCSKSEDYSEQYLVSCNVEGMNCDAGGWFSHSYHYNFAPAGEPIAGAVRENAFPYTASNGQCVHPYPHPVRLSSGEIDIASDDQTIMTQIYQHGAVGTYICVNTPFSTWVPSIITPVFTGPDCTDLNHAVVLVGYNRLSNPPYWILRNSWGPLWGDGGYMYIKMGIAGVGSGANVADFDGCTKKTHSATPTELLSLTQSSTGTKTHSQTLSSTTSQSSHTNTNTHTLSKTESGTHTHTNTETHTLTYTQTISAYALHLVCQPNSCLNGGICKSLPAGGANMFVCECPLGTSLPRCETCNRNGVCEGPENCINCPSDCNNGTSGRCGNGICEPLAFENCYICPWDCKGRLGYCCGYNYVGCGNAVCGIAPYSCSTTTGGSWCCGDGKCSTNEICPRDCTAAPAQRLKSP